MAVDPPLRYAIYAYEPFFTSCGALKYPGPACANKGANLQFFEEFSGLLGVTFQSVQTSGYGTRGIDERNDTALKMLRLGLIDFVGPYADLDNNPPGFIRSVPIIYSDIEVYTRTQYASTEYNAVDFLGKTVFWMVVFSTAFTYLLPRASKFSKNRFLFVKLNNASKLLFLMTITVALNIFGSKLSVRVVQRLIQHPKIESIDSIRYDLLSQTNKLCLRDPESGISLGIARQINGRQMLAGLNRNVLFSNSEAGFLDSIVKSKCTGCHSTYGTRSTTAWFEVCNRITTTQVSHIFGNTRHGFLFSPATLSKTAKFRSFIHRNHRAISKLYRQVFKIHLMNKQRYWKCDEGQLSEGNSFVITMSNMWNMSFKSILFIGLGMASFIFVVEFSSRLVAKQLRRIFASIMT